MGKASSLGSISLFLAGLALGAEAIPNWSAPAVWSPSRAAGVRTLADITNPLPFIGVTPCRVADTRGNGFTGVYGPPSLVHDATRTFVITGQCGIPASAAAVSFNFGALNVGGAGDLRVFPAGGAVPLVSTMNYNANTPNIANAAIVPLGSGGGITVQADAVSIDLIIDINGYYSSTTSGNRLASGEYLGIFGTRDGDGVIYGENNSGVASSFGIRGNYTGTAASGSGVRGEAQSAQTYGVMGLGGNGFDGAGVRGVDGSGSPTGGNSFQSAGVRGESLANVGVLGLSQHDGVAGVGLNSSGVIVSFGALGANQGTAPSGVLGRVSSAVADVAGVLGIDASGSAGVSGRGSAGVRGESFSSFGILGLSTYIGVVGSLYTSGGALLAEGFLGSSFGTAPGPFSPPWGVFASGNLGATGVKHFVEPHPADPTKVILYSSLEGREVGTYFRGTAHTVKGESFIEVPEDFRIVTDEEGLTVQLTAIGAPPTMYVASKDLHRIVVRSEKDLQFDYLVHGVRRAFKDFEPVAKGMEFAPRSAEDRMPAYLTEEAKRRLVANGTYNADGTVNMETAERVGWTRIWKEREERDKAAAAANAAAHAARLAEGK